MPPDAIAVFSFPVDSVQAAGSISGIQAILSDLRPFWPQARTLFGNWERRQFDSEGQWGGDPWEALTPNYVAWKVVNFPGRLILVATRKMRDAATAPKIVENSPQRFVLKIDDPKAGFHQFGAPRAGLPRRPMIPDEWPDEAERELRDKLEEYVTRMAARFGIIGPTMGE